MPKNSATAWLRSRAVAELAWTACAGGAVVLFCACFLLQDQRFFWRDDYQTYQLAGFYEVAQAWADGEFPLLSRHSWQGGALAAEYQYGVFSIFLTGCVLMVFGLGLSLPLAAAVLSVVHLVVLATGTFRLARCKGMSPDLSMLAALVSALSGWIFLWGARAWFPALASFAWIPWFWWALHGALEKHALSRALLAGIFLYLIITAGWPFSVLMAVLLTLWLTLRTWCAGRFLVALCRPAAAWVLGLGLSAPAWLMLMQYSPHTWRGQTPSLLVTRSWMVPVDALAGLVFPPHVTFWEVFYIWKLHACHELAGGLVPLAILGAALAGVGRRVFRACRWEAGLCALTLLLALSPGLGNFQYGFRWLPLFFLTLGLVAAQSLALLRTSGSLCETVPEAESTHAGRRDKPWSNPGLWAFVLVLVVAARALMVGFDLTATTSLYAAAMALVCFLWARVETDAEGPDIPVRPGRTRVSALRLTPIVRKWMPCGVVLLSCWLAYVSADRFREVPSWDLEDHVGNDGPLDPSIRYLSVHTNRDIFELTDPYMPSATGRGEALYPGNSFMYSGLHFVNGYSPLMPRGLTDLFAFRWHGYMTPQSAERVLTREAAPGRLLELMGVDGLVLADRFDAHAATLVAGGWRQVATLDGGTLWHRTGPPSPRVRAAREATRVADHATAIDMLTDPQDPQDAPLPILVLDADGWSEKGSVAFAPAHVTVVQESRNAALVEVTALSPDRDILIVFARPWYPGYRAICNGCEVAVQRLNLILLAVRLPAGTTGRLLLEYRPWSLVAGCRIALVTVTLALLASLLAVWRRRWRPWPWRPRGHLEVVP